MSTPIKTLLTFLAIVLIILLLFAKGPFLIVVFFIATVLIASLINISRIRIIGIEFATFIGVVTAIAYDPLIGAILGAVLVTMHMIVANYIGPYIVWVVPSYAIGSYFAGIIGSTGNVAITGLYAVLLINGISMFFTVIFYRRNIGAYIPYLLTNVIINFFMFSVLGENTLALLRA